MSILGGKERGTKIFNSVLTNIKKITHMLFFDIDAGVIVPFCDGKLFLARANGYQLIVPNDDSLFYVREVEEVYLRPSLGDVVIDVGAHYGFYTLLTSKIIGKSGCVLAFEPNPANFQGLLKNIQLNESTNVKAINVALGNFDGKTKLYLWNDTGGHSTVFKRQNWMLVEMRKLDDMIEASKLRKVKGMLIKIDAEGAELKVLEGAMNTIKAFKPKLTIAAYHYNNEIKQIIQYLKRTAPFYCVKITRQKFLHAIPCQ